jgi:hypothetical protein
MWERYHFFAAQELEQWKGCYVGCVVVPKKFLRYYDERCGILRRGGCTDASWH